MINFEIFTNMVSQTLQIFGFADINISKLTKNKDRAIIYNSLSTISLEINHSCIILMLELPHTTLDFMYQQMYKKTRINKKQVEDLGKELANIIAGKFLEGIKDPKIQAHIFFPKIYYKTTLPSINIDSYTKKLSFSFSSQEKPIMDLSLFFTPVSCKSHL